MVRFLTIEGTFFLGIYLLSCWLDKRKTRPDQDAVVNGVLVRFDTGIGCGRYYPLFFVTPTIRFES